MQEEGSTQGEGEPQVEAREITACELCGRPEKLTVHHLIPRTRHRHRLNNRRKKRRFTRKEANERVAMLCRPCHSNVHAVFTEKELERDWNTVEALAVHPDIAKFTEWVAGKPVGTRIPVRTSNAQRQRRSRGRR